MLGFFILLLVLIATIAFPVWRHKQAKKQNIHSKKRGLVTALATFCIFFFGFAIAGHFMDDGDSSSDEQATQHESKKSSKKSEKKSSAKSSSESKSSSKSSKKMTDKEKQAAIADANAVLKDDLAARSELSTFIDAIKYEGDMIATVEVNDNFMDLSSSKKDVVAKAVNNEVISVSSDDDDEMDAMNGANLYFTYDGRSIGRSKVLDHQEYKWKD